MKTGPSHLSFAPFFLFFLHFLSLAFFFFPSLQESRVCLSGSFFFILHRITLNTQSNKRCNVAELLSERGEEGKKFTFSPHPLLSEFRMKIQSVPLSRAETTFISLFSAGVFFFYFSECHSTLCMLFFGSVSVY